MDYYTLLGVSKTSSPDEIKKAYRKLASQHHPDKGGDTAMFQQIEEAYRTLSDPQKRQQYDNPRPQGMPGGMGGFHFNANDFNLNDIFAQVFGGGGFGGQGHPFGQHQHRTQQQMFRTQVALSLEDSYKGITQTLRLQTQNETKMVNIDVPKGIDNGNQIRYDKVLEQGLLLVEFRILPHLRFERKGNDLYCNQSISVLDLIVGTSFEFTTISGKTLEIKVAPKTQPNMQLKISGQGMPIPNSNIYGDQIIVLKPYIPDTIDSEITDSILRSKQK